RKSRKITIVAVVSASPVLAPKAVWPAPSEDAPNAPESPPPDGRWMSTTSIIMTLMTTNSTTSMPVRIALSPRTAIESSRPYGNRPAPRHPTEHRSVRRVYPNAQRGPAGLLGRGPDDRGEPGSRQRRPADQPAIHIRTREDLP